MEEFIGGILMVAIAIILMVFNFAILSRIESKIDRLPKQLGGTLRT
jgi:hypothetical protein